MAPKLVYFPVAGRGELSRLIAAVGGIEGFESLHALPEGLTPSDFGSTGTMPLLMDGDDLKINESGAIEAYLSLIAPKYANLTPKQRARDAQFSQLKESALSGVAKIIFNREMSPEDKATNIKAFTDKLLPAIEGILPKEGFINGLDDPTPADLAIVNIAEGYMPFGAGCKVANISISDSFPKIFAHSERTKANADVAKALEESKTLKAAFPGM